jgi:hypothetical protein
VSPPYRQWISQSTLVAAPSQPQPQRRRRAGWLGCGGHRVSCPHGTEQPPPLRHGRTSAMPSTSPGDVCPRPWGGRNQRFSHTVRAATRCVPTPLTLAFTPRSRINQWSPPSGA